MSIAYWAVVICGAVTLVIEAYRQFSISVDLRTHDRYPILKDVDMDALCTTAELIRGFLMYVSLYLGAYALILGSTEVFEVVATTTSVAAGEGPTVPMIVGARDDVVGTDGSGVVSEISSLDLGKPIFVSAAIIAALSMGIFSPIEKIMRSYAHWIAGIPRGVYRVISRLKRANYERISKSYRRPLTEAYIEKVTKFKPDGIDQEIIDATKSSLVAIDMIQPAVTGQVRDQIFTAYMPETIQALITRQEASDAAFRDQLKALTDNPDDLQAFQVEAGTNCNNLQALFALLFIRNQKEIEVSTARNATMRLIEHTQSDRDPAFHALTGAVFFMLIAVLICYPLAFIITIKPGPAIGFGDIVRFIRNETIVAILQSLLIFGICAATALLSREASKEYGRWPEWPLNQVPFLRLFQHSVFPGVAAVVICVLAKLAEYLLTVQAEGSFDEFVRINWEFCLMNFVFGFVIALAVFVVVDQHRNFKASRTVALALAAIAPYVIWAAFVQTLNTNYTSIPDPIWMGREIFLLAFPGVSFAVAFALLIEWSEGGSA